MNNTIRSQAEKLSLNRSSEDKAWGKSTHHKYHYGLVIAVRMALKFSGGYMTGAA